MDVENINEVCNYIKEIFKHSWHIVFSWGAVEFENVVYKDMSALKFPVNGFAHKGYVVVAFNIGDDAFEVYCLNENDDVVKSKDDVYFDELVGVIDSLVEKDCSDKEYDKKLEEWLNNPK